METITVAPKDELCSAPPSTTDILRQLRKEEAELKDKAIAQCLAEMQTVLDKYGMALRVIQQIQVLPK